MDQQSRMLIWNEIRQRRAQLILCMLWMVCGTAYCIAYEWSKEFRAPVASFYAIAFLYALPVPIFMAMRTSLGEITDRTRTFSDGLPISARRRGWIRVAGGAGVLVGPIVAGALMLSVCLALGWLEQAPPHPSHGPDYIRLEYRESLSALSAVGLVWCVTAVVAWSGTGLYLVLSLLGTTLRAESHLGYCGAAMACLWFLGTALGPVFEELNCPGIAAWIGAIAPQTIIVNYGYGGAHGSYGDLAISRKVLGPLLINAALQLGLAALFVRGYSRRLSGRGTERGLKTARRAWWTLRLPTLRLPTRGMALAWLALRQSVPMCLPGLMLACLLTLFQLDMQPQHRQEHFLGRYIDAMPSSMWIVGLLWAVVVGAGIFSSEIDWRIGEFWRTRPIPAWRLFAVKFVAGLLAVLLVLDATVIAATWRSPNWGDYHSMSWPYIACFLPLHATMFAIAVAWTCVLRRAVLGGMAAIATYALTNVALEWSDVTREFDPLQVYNRLGQSMRAGESVDFSTHGYPVAAAAMTLTLLASILVAWLALRRYDPRRQTG